MKNEKLKKLYKKLFKKSDKVVCTKENEICTDEKIKKMSDELKKPELKKSKSKKNSV